ncbi:hypothetical protein [Hydrogenivirga sp.]
MEAGVFRLGDVLIKYMPDHGEDFKEFDVGSFREREGWRFLEPHGKSWDLKAFRPFLLVHLDTSYAYMVFFSTSSFFFRCPEDEIYGILFETPTIDFEKCFINNPECRWIKGEPKIFKRRHKRGCSIVLRLGKTYLEELSVLCGHCPEPALPEKLKEIIELELGEWKKRN